MPDRQTGTLGMTTFLCATRFRPRPPRRPSAPRLRRVAGRLPSRLTLGPVYLPAMSPFALLKAAASASETLDQAREFIRGGHMTDIFEQMGDVHLNSAIEHVRQAVHSSDPVSRLVQATGDLQNAYLLFLRAAGSGPSRKLRILMDMPNLSKARAGATDCASAVALIQWTIGESVPNRRLWLDRASRQIAVHSDELRQRWEMGNPEKYMDFGARQTTLFESLQRLEVNTLPAGVQRAGRLSVEDADKYRRPTDADRYNANVILARHYCEQELQQPWTDPMR